MLRYLHACEGECCDLVWAPVVTLLARIANFAYYCVQNNFKEESSLALVSFFMPISVPGNVSSIGQDNCREPVTVIVT